MKANLLRLGDNMKSQVKSFCSYGVIHSLLKPFKYSQNEATTSGAASDPCVCVFPVSLTVDLRFSLSQRS